MFKKLAAFFKGFFGNVKADPVSTTKGVVQLAAAGATAYGMATGTVPVTELTTGFVAATAASGIHALGTNTATGVTQPEAVKAAEAITTAAAMVPTVTGIVDQVTAMKAAADDGQAKVEAFQAVSQALQQVIPAEQK